MKSFIVLILLIVIWCLAAYLGLCVMLIGGIVQVVNGIKADPTSGLDIAVGLARTILFQVPFLVAGFCSIFIYGWGVRK